MNLIVDRGAGTLTTDANPAHVTFSTGLMVQPAMGDPAGFSLAIQDARNNGSILDLHVSTVGFESIVVRFDRNRTDGGFNSLTFQYSTDGITFTDIFTALDSPVEPGQLGFGVGPFAMDSGVANNPLFTVRFILNGATGTAGLIRFDNIRVEGTPTAVPEPMTLLLLGTGIFGAVGAGRRRGRMKEDKHPGPVISEFDTLPYGDRPIAGASGHDRIKCPHSWQFQLLRWSK